MTSEGADASEDGTGRGTPIVVHSVHENQRGELTTTPDCMGTLKTGGGKPGRGYPCIVHPLGPPTPFQQPCEPSPASQPETVVRRLTPLECERLQGYPDGYTSEQYDSAQYRQLGNSVAVPVVEWLARRVVSAHAQM